MKNILNSTISMFTILAVLFSLVGCSGGISGDEAKAHISQFLDAVKAEDYELASTFLHPERPADLESFKFRKRGITRFFNY